MAVEEATAPQRSLSQAGRLVAVEASQRRRSPAGMGLGTMSTGSDAGWDEGSGCRYRRSTEEQTGKRNPA